MLTVLPLACHRRHADHNLSPHRPAPPRRPAPRCAAQVLCASNDAHDQVDPITPPEGVPNGERITFEG